MSVKGKHQHGLRATHGGNPPSREALYVIEYQARGRWRKTEYTTLSAARAAAEAIFKARSIVVGIKEVRATP